MVGIADIRGMRGAAPHAQPQYVYKFFVCASFIVWASGQVLQTPTVAGVANASSYAAGSVSPGEIVTLFGSGMGPDGLVGLALNANGNVATSLASTMVLFDGTPAPMIYTSAKQVSAIVPYSVAGKSFTSVVVQYNGLASRLFSIAVASAVPGLFTSDASGHGQAAAVNQDGTINSPGQPAPAGSIISLYLTGEGQTTPACGDGQIANGTLPAPVLPVSVTIGGLVADILYAGTAPASVCGFMQINARIPMAVISGPGPSVPVLVNIGTASSQSGVTITVTGGTGVRISAPSGLVATATSDTQISVIWTFTDSGASDFVIERKTGVNGTYAQVATVPPSARSYTDTGLAPTTSYVYRMRADAPTGLSDYSTEAGTTTAAAVIPPPTGLQATATSPTQILLSWTNPSGSFSRIHVERKSGAQGSYAELAAVAAPANSYQDNGLTPSTSYTYRARAESSAGLSGYSNEATASTPALPLPPAPSLQATGVSSSQIHLAWTSAATGIVRFHVERRIATTQYAEIFQPASTTTSFDDTVLTGSTTYFYRMRVETAAGLSPYSNEVNVTTLQAPPAAPTNLQAVATSPTQATLTWTNNAPEATVIRIEVQTGSTGQFQDIGAAVTLTASGVNNLQPSTSYAFRVRAQRGQDYSSYSNVASITTPAQIRTVLVIHGIRQSNTDMEALAQALQAALDPSRFAVDFGFNYGPCTTHPDCTSVCTISTGASTLALHIQQNVASSHILIVGYSLGGLIARDMILNNYGNILSTHHVDGLVTLGTPNLGYPYEPIDDSKSCPVLDLEMQGNYRDPRGFVWSTYLSALNEKWISGPLPTGSLPWLAIAGTACANPLRWTGGILDQKPDPNTGCRNANANNDNVVCEDSAFFDLSSIGLKGQNQPTQLLYDPAYSHTTLSWFEDLFVESLFSGCSWANTESLSQPQPDLLPSVVQFLTSH